MLLRGWPQILSFGIWHGPEAYFKRHLNWLDFSVMVALWYSVLQSQSGFQRHSQGVHSIRLLRLLRLVVKIEWANALGLSAAYQGMRASKEDIVAVVLVLVIILLGFVNFSMQLFGGLFARCNDEIVEGLADCTGVLVAPAIPQLGSPLSVRWDTIVLRPRQWAAPLLNFDSFGEAAVAAYALFLNNGWPDLIDSSMSVAPAGQQFVPFGRTELGAPY
jgi:hypothetical protein